MPEGDSLHTMAASIGPHLVGEPIERLRLRDRGEVGVVRGHAIDRVEVVGKHLLVLIARRWTLHVHLGLRGRWRLHESERPSEAAVVASTATLVVPRAALTIARSARHELRPYRDMRLEQELRRLGPDLLAPVFDVAEAVARARAPGHRELAVTDLLLDQTVVAGIGNVYRSEVLFLVGTYPWTPVGALEDATLGTLFECARTLMQSNVGAGSRATVGSLRGERRQPGRPRLWVYRREGLPCLRCGTLVRRSIEGRRARSTYWCPRCQPDPRIP
ncbi:MAG: Fpg/Nei family DNA glycosylase [Myxococcales bacterium]|nr:Fpg/Nei family DNA glycosylase [Myxococcales bacterium]